MYKILAFLVVLFVPAVLLAQSPRSAVGGESSLWVGGEFSSFNPDYACRSNSPFQCNGHLLMGPTVTVDYNLRSKWGAEGEARWLHWNGVGNQTESNYVIGGRYRAYRLGRLDLWVKLLLGGGWIKTPNYPVAGSLEGSYFIYVPGGTLDYPLTHRLRIRGDYEYQMWPSFEGPPTVSGTTYVLHNHGLSPNGFSLGVEYRILGQ